MALWSSRQVSQLLSEMICVPATLRKHGGFFFPSVTGCCTECLPGSAHPCGAHRRPRAAAERLRGLVCGRGDRQREEAGWLRECTCSPAQLRGCECHFVHAGIAASKPNFRTAVATGCSVGCWSPRDDTRCEFALLCLRCLPIFGSLQSSQG